MKMINEISFSRNFLCVWDTWTPGFRKQDRCWRTEHRQINHL